MGWTYEEIEREWLAGSRIAVEPPYVVAAFDRCERVLGRGWIDRAHGGNIEGASKVTGSAPTLGVVTMGLILASLDDVADSQQLVDKIRSADQSAIAELRAIHLLRSGEVTRVELEPIIQSVDGTRKCDFRIQRDTEPWVYVEVTAPDTSDAHAHVESLLQSICDKVSSVKKPFALEVFFRREPSDAELEAVLTAALGFCSAEHPIGTVIKEEMPSGMGLLILNQQSAGHVVINDHGEETVPRLGMARSIIGPGEPNRTVSVRMPYADQRAERFLTSEARQLPVDAPGLIMVEMARAPGGFHSWGPVVQRRFQPAMHTRVGGVCLFSSGLVPTDQGEASLFQTKLIINQHARIPLPEWNKTTIDAAGEKFELSTRPGRRSAEASV
jgi:hypothetical protein